LGDCAFVINAVKGHISTEFYGIGDFLGLIGQMIDIPFIQGYRRQEREVMRRGISL